MPKKPRTGQTSKERRKETGRRTICLRSQLVFGTVFEDVTKEADRHKSLCPNDDRLNGTLESGDT